MTVTLTLWQELRLILWTALATLGGLSVARYGLWLDGPEPLHIAPRDTIPLGAFPLRPFPGEGIVTHNELDQFARHYQGITR